MATGAVNGVLGVVFVFVFVIVICCKCCMQCEIFLFAIFNSAQGRGVEGENRVVVEFVSVHWSSFFRRPRRRRSELNFVGPRVVVVAPVSVHSSSYFLSPNASRSSGWRLL